MPEEKSKPVFLSRVFGVIFFLAAKSEQSVHQCREFDPLWVKNSLKGEFVSHFFSFRSNSLMSTRDKSRRENDSFASFDTFFTTPAGLDGLSNRMAGQYIWKKTN